jgi:hypothetical protein
MEALYSPHMRRFFVSREYEDGSHTDIASGPARFNILPVGLLSHRNSA